MSRKKPNRKGRAAENKFYTTLSHAVLRRPTPWPNHGAFAGFNNAPRRHSRAAYPYDTANKGSKTLQTTFNPSCLMHSIEVQRMSSSKMGPLTDCFCF